jgi:hypothetical protein
MGRQFRRPDDDWPLLALFVQSRDGVEVAHVPGAWLQLGRHKSVMMRALKQAMHYYDGGVLRFALLANVHAVTHIDDETLARVRADEIRIEDLPGAVEHLWLTVGDAETEEHWRATIQRDQRRPPTLTPWLNVDEVEDVTTLRGRFIGLNDALR